MRVRYAKLTFSLSLVAIAIFLFAPMAAFADDEMQEIPTGQMLFVSADGDVAVHGDTNAMVSDAADEQEGAFGQTKDSSSNSNVENMGSQNADTNETGDIADSEGVTSTEPTAESVSPVDQSESVEEELDPVKEYVANLYRSVLGREPDADGLDFWCLRIKSGMGAGTVAQGFFNSKEFENRGLGSQDVVEIAYDTFLDRDPDSSGFDHWTSMLDDGMSNEVIVVGFGNSSEFGDLCDEWGVSAGTVARVRNEARDENRAVTAFVSSLYTKVLDRSYDVDGLNNWCGNYFSMGLGAYELSLEFFRSGEFSERGLSNPEIVDCAYQTLVDRDADDQGKSDWLHRLRNGMGISMMISGICLSKEYRSVCEEKAIRVGNPPDDSAEITQYQGYGVTDYAAFVDGREIVSSYVSRTPYLFLSSCASLDSIMLYFTTYFGEQEIYVSSEENGGYRLFHSGDVLDVLSTGLKQDQNGAYILYTKDYLTDKQTAKLCIMKSSGVLTMYIISDDPVEKGREYIDGSYDHSTKASATMVLLDADGNVRYGAKESESAITIKGRGNTTWRKGEKKPYQIKLDKKTDLLDTGLKNNKSKTWILLANATDATLIRNSIALDLAAELGLDVSPEYDFVDVFYDGDYRGSYVLCEKCEVDSGRVNITDLEDANEEANPGIDIESQPIASAVNRYGYQYTYVEGVASPDDISGGYLLELDRIYGKGEASWFTTSFGLTFAVKSPEYATQEEMIYISELMEEALQSINENGINSLTGKKIGEYFDLESLASLFLLKETIKDFDGFTSSTFFYKDAGDDAIYSGPMWDADSAFGTRISSGNTDYTGYAILFGESAGLGYAMLSCSSLMGMVSSIYSKTLRPLMEDLLSLEVGPSVTVQQPISKYVERVGASEKLNEKKWGFVSFDYCKEPFGTYEENIGYLRYWLTNRVAWLDGQLCA